MKIVPPCVELLACTPDPELLIERCGRVAYKSEDLIGELSSVKFIKMIMKRGHTSVIEHASATLLFTTDRGVTHEAVRHRLIAATQESTRYCGYDKGKFGNEISVLQPPFVGSEDDIRNAIAEWTLAMLDAERHYLNLRTECHQPPEIARSVLPNSLKADIAISANFREWVHILDLRTSKYAHPQIREVMLEAAAQLYCQAPTVFGNVYNTALELIRED